jgi:hypothetical protein
MAMNTDPKDLRRTGAAETSLWRLGDVLEELLNHYGLAEASRLPPGRAAICGEVGVFGAADLPAATASAY